MDSIDSNSKTNKTRIDSLLATGHLCTHGHTFITQMTRRYIHSSQSIASRGIFMIILSNSPTTNGRDVVTPSKTKKSNKKTLQTSRSQLNQHNAISTTFDGSYLVSYPLISRSYVIVIRVWCHKQFVKSAKENNAERAKELWPRFMFDPNGFVNKCVGDMAWHGMACVWVCVCYIPNCRIESELMDF